VNKDDQMIVAAFNWCRFNGHSAIDKAL